MVAMTNGLNKIKSFLVTRPPLLEDNDEDMIFTILQMLKDLMILWNYRQGIV